MRERNEEVLLTLNAYLMLCNSTWNLSNLVMREAFHNLLDSLVVAVASIKKKKEKTKAEAISVI